MSRHLDRPKQAALKLDRDLDAFSARLKRR